MDRKKNLAGMALIVGLMALTGFLLLRDQPFAKLAGILRRLNPAWLLLGLGLIVAGALLLRLSKAWR